MVTQPANNIDLFHFWLKSPVSHKNTLLVLTRENIPIVEEEVVRCHNKPLTITLHVNFAVSFLAEFIVFVLSYCLDHDAIFEEHSESVFVDTDF